MDKQLIITMIIIFGLIIILPLVLYGICKGIDTTIHNYEKTEQFETISRKQYKGDTYIEIIYDKETKVKYIYIDGYKGDGITALIDENGKPVLYQGE